MFLLILSNVVSAQVRPSTFSVTPYIGGYLFDKDQKLGNAPVYGISLGYNFTKYFGVELSGEGIHTNYDLGVSDSRSTNVGNYRFDGVLNLIRIVALFHLSSPVLAVSLSIIPKTSPINPLMPLTMAPA
jgi:OOP family OmpA-OmpF porin